MTPINCRSQADALAVGEPEFPRSFSAFRTSHAPLLAGCWAAVVWIPLAYAILRYGAVETAVWCTCLAGIGMTTLLYHACTSSSESAPPPSRALCWALVALPVYVLLQAVPIPIGLLSLLSPQRAEIASSLQRAGIPLAYAPLSVVPSETLFDLFRIAGGTLLFLAARNLVWRWPGRAWVVALPLLFVGCAEAVLGVFQFFATPEGFAHGTYVHRNHFSGFLEMALPFAAAYPFASGGRRSIGTRPWEQGLRIGMGIVAAVLLLVAITQSLSRSGFGVAFGSLALMSVVALVRSRIRSRLLIGIGAVAVLAILMVLLPSEQLSGRLQRTFDSQGNLEDMRTQVWSDTGRLASAFPIFGCGLGGFEAAFHQYRVSALRYRLDFAHNDYLQTIAELGLAGSTIVVLLCGALLVECVRAVRYSPHGALALASAGALAAMAAHSVTDFNLHIPANALVLAWVAGIASGLSATTRKAI